MRYRGVRLYLARGSILGYGIASILVSCWSVSIIAALLSLGALSGMSARAGASWRIMYAATVVVVQQEHR